MGAKPETLAALRGTPCFRVDGVHPMRCVIAGGGTGGHLFPGLAIADAFTEREMGNEVLFIGTEGGLEARILAEGRFPLRTIPVRPLLGGSWSARARALGILPRSIWEARNILKDFRPHVVLGVGGYASGPALVAAFLLRIKRAIHEQNLVPGMTKRLLRWFSNKSSSPSKRRRSTSRSRKPG